MPPRRRKLKQTFLPGFFSSPPSSPSSLFPKSPSPPLKRKRRQTRESSSSSSSSPDAVSTADSDVNAIRFEPTRVDISDEDRSPRRPRKRRSLAGAHTIPARASSDDSLDAPIGPQLRRRKSKRKVVIDSDDDNGPRRRKLIRGVRPPTPEGDDDIVESENQVLESRLRSRGKMTAFQKNLEKLKTLKGKKRSEMLLESSSEEERSDSSAGVPFRSAKPHHDGDSDASEATGTTGEEEEDSFIVQDDLDGVLATQLPPAFSLSAHQDLAHQFKIICQLFVHLAVRPLVDRRPFFEHALKEEYFCVPLQMTRRKLSGLRDSLVASSVWRLDFKRSLERYPTFTLARLDFTVPQCDACHLGGRVSTLLGRLSGKAYDAYDFENLSDEESDENEDDDSDDDGKRNVREEFHLGRFCAARTQVYHQFSQWEYSLYKSLQREITRAQDTSFQFVSVAYSGGIRPPRDLHDADRVMEWLDQRRIIDMEWQKVRQMMESARSLDRGEVDEAILL